MQTLGTAVFSGMLGVTPFGIFLTPVFYCLLQGASDWWASPATQTAPLDTLAAVEGTAGN
jgi:HAE1 family hydrophobic/amphiphilic exporter-1